jgi:transaldolase / glucose-6-phosphate isomerase
VNALLELGTKRQSVWLDFISRQLLASGRIATMIERDGLKGMTSNPAIFEKAIDESSDYDAELEQLVSRSNLSTIALYEELTIHDIQNAADVLRPVYDSTEKRDGYISIEVSPYLAADTEGTIEEGRQLWQRVDRRNVMIKVPATAEGIAAIRQLIADGINVNITLLFDQQAYEAVAIAYIEGLEIFAAGGGDVSRIASVASFFISRIDAMIDPMIQAKAALAPAPAEKARIERLLGKVAIANAKCAYKRYKKIFSGDRWAKLAGQGARTQRLLWASTGTKNKAYSDVLYVEELIGPDTVNTMPPDTMDAFRDHGKVKSSIDYDVAGAERVMSDLASIGISMTEVAGVLVSGGVKLFGDAADKVLSAVDAKRTKMLGDRLNSMTWKLPADLEKAVGSRIEDWRTEGRIRRLWKRDPEVWTGQDEGNWLGWLESVSAVLDEMPTLLAFERDAAKFDHVLLLGMGGSSLGPEVLATTFGKQKGRPALHVLDSTDPAQIKAFEAKVDLAKTVFIVSSKSGGTLEPNILKQYFFDRARSVVGAEEVGKRFVAVTDPGSPMQKVAEGDNFRNIFFGNPAIGGRYSVLSNFGMVPAVAAGIDIARILDSTQMMIDSCGPTVPPAANPGVLLGTILGVAGRLGRDKVTIIASSELAGFGAWAEQLIAESTGKRGKGLIPVDREPVGPPEVYGGDRTFVSLSLAGVQNAAETTALDKLEAAGHPVVRISVGNRHQLGQEFFRWEMATAVASSILGVNAFDQPDVEASKLETKRLTWAYEQTGSLPREQPFANIDGIRVFAEHAYVSMLRSRITHETLSNLLRVHFAQLRPGDYAALLAYIHHDKASMEALQRLRLAIRSTHRVATVVGFGPRFLHSTGQAYKGGPNSGVFLQITCEDPIDLPVPGQKYSFGLVKAAQAQGDLSVLLERHRRALRIHLPADLGAGLSTLDAAFRQALI